MTRPGRIQDKDVCTIEELCRDRDFSVATDLDSDKKKRKKEKKKTIGIWGVTIIFFLQIFSLKYFQLVFLVF